MINLKNLKDAMDARGEPCMAFKVQNEFEESTEKC